MNVSNRPVNSTAEVVSYNIDSSDSMPKIIYLDYFAFSIGVQNNTAADLKVWTNKYGTQDDYVLVPAGTYKEIATTTNYIKVDGTVVGSETINIDVVRTLGVDTLSTPVFPTLYSLAADNNAGVDIKINPINLGGFTWTPWVTSTGEASISANEAVLNVEYWLNGQFVARLSSTNFYEDFYAMVMNTVASFYPAGYVAPTNPNYDPAQVSEVEQKIQEFLSAFNAPINDEYIEGWASLQVFDQGLYLTKVQLDAASPVTKYQTPFPVLGWSVRETSGTNTATIDYSDDGSTWITINLAAGASQAVSGVLTKYWRVTSGTVEITFSGRAVKMIEFAPIINIFYPIGLDDTTGAPADALAAWQNYLANFKNNLQATKFTGRVLYWKSLPFSSEQKPAWSADHYTVKMAITKIHLVWEKVRNRAWIWTAKSPVEDDIIKKVIQENYAYYYGGTGHPLPTTLDELIADPNITVYGAATPTEKADKLIGFLLEEYTGHYSKGGLNDFFSIPR